MVVAGVVVMAVSVNFSGRGVRLPISGTSMVKVDTLRVVRVGERVVVTLLVYLVEVVVDTVRVMTGTWLEVGRNTVWYTRVVVVVVVEHRIEIHTQRMRVMVMVVLRLTADAVVRVLFLSKRTLHPRTAVRLQSSRSGTHEDEVYHQPLTIWDRKLTGSILSMVRPCRRISYQHIGTSIQLVIVVIMD